MQLEPLSWSETFSRLRADRQRLGALLAQYEEPLPPMIWLHPSFICVVLYRISHHLYRGGHRYLARCVWHLNTLVTGADISAPANLGPGLVILCPPATAIMGTAGINLTVMPGGGVGGEVGRRADIGAGPGLPVIGNDVILEPHCGVLGPIRIGHRVRVPAGIAVTEDIPDDTVVEGARPRFLKRRELE